MILNLHKSSKQGISYSLFLRFEILSKFAAKFFVSLAAILPYTRSILSRKIVLYSNKYNARVSQAELVAETTKILLFGWVLKTWRIASTMVVVLPVPYLMFKKKVKNDEFV
jgi:uncharacterized membrane protein YccF (DUF307 family)